MLATLFLLAATASPDVAYKNIEDRYVREFLRRHPVVSTYLGGSGLDPSLGEVDGMLRDWSPRALESEARFYREIETQLKGLDAERLSVTHRIDREVVLNQIAFTLRQTEKRRHWQRSVDTYVNEPFRGLDWYLQGMKDLGEGRYGAEEEWRHVVARVAAVPTYLKTARTNLAAGLAAGNLPDPRVVEREGVKASEANARYFEKELLETAAARTKGQAFAPKLAADLGAKAKAAAVAFRDLRTFLVESFGKVPSQDRFAMGALDYDWALQNNLGVLSTAAKLYDESQAPIAATRREIILTAARVADRLGLDLKWGETEREASTRAVMNRLDGDAPTSDAEMREAYEAVGRRLVEFGRKSGMFDVPADYRLDVTVTPPVLANSVDSASYYPAPIFRGAGVGRFYIPITNGDPELLKQNNRHAMAYLAAHEGFPGHDWHYKVMTEHRDGIGPARWLTPGEVEGSASMWQDSAATEGWGLYAEQLMGEPAKGAPDGFYTPEERLYQLRGQLLRDLRVRIDTGLHTGRMGYDEAVDFLSSSYDFLPGACGKGELAPVKKASCVSAERAIYRYSKWPTQAVSYRLGKQQILALRAKADALTPPADRKRFHLLYMEQGTIPPVFFEDALLAQLRGK